MRLLDLVEENHRIRPAPDSLSQLPALVVAHIARRRADQPRDRVLLHVLAHVDAHHRLLIVEHELSQRPRRLRLAHARRPKKNKRTNRPLRIAQPRARTPNRIGHDGQRRVLPDDPLAQPRLHLDELLYLALQHPRDGNPRPLADDAGDVFLIDLFLQHPRHAAHCPSCAALNFFSSASSLGSSPY